MSEPVQTSQLDLSALDQALNETSEGGMESSIASGKSNGESRKADAAAAGTAAPDSLAAHSETLAQPPTDAGRADHQAKAEQTDSPATLSPTSARSDSPALAEPAKASNFDDNGSVPPVRTLATPVQKQEQPAGGALLSEPVKELKAMFPDFDTDTIGAILASTSGNQEAAVNALLQMSDPSYRPPSATTDRTDSDALLAQTLAAEEERNHQLRQRQYQTQSAGGRGGGGSASLLSEIGSMIGGGAGAQKSATPTYDASQLNYQPRVRKQPPPGSARSAYAAPSASGRTSGQGVLPELPGPSEAKQWQEEINRMAETGLARAASTFSSLRQRAEAALANSQTPSPGPASGARPSQGDGTGSTADGFWRSSQPSGRGGGGASSYLHNFSSAFTSNSTSKDGGRSAATRSDDRVGGLASPKSPQMGEYDRDPSPVGDNELAKILARGRGSGRSDNNGKSRALADRYGHGASPLGGSEQSQGDLRASDDYIGWEQAGRTPLKDGNTPVAGTSAAGSGKAKDSIALMDSAQGRGVMSPSLASSQQEKRDLGPATGVAAAAGLGIGAAAAGVKVGSSSEGDDGSDSDDLEYVSNPFEDED